VIKLSFDTLVAIHSDLVSQSGGLDGIRDSHLLESALNAPFQTFGGKDLYPTLEKKAAQLAFSLIKNHPFQDGNKRIGIVAMVTFLKRNGLSVSCTDEELISLGLGLADDTFDKEYLENWLALHITP
jgi:death-on-curing protein